MFPYHSIFACVLARSSLENSVNIFVFFGLVQSERFARPPNSLMGLHNAVFESTRCLEIR